MEVTSKSQAGPGIIAGRETLALATDTAGSTRHLLMIICSMDNLVQSLSQHLSSIFFICLPNSKISNAYTS
jgi:hypothetical protein